MEFFREPMYEKYQSMQIWYGSDQHENPITVQLCVKTFISNFFLFISNINILIAVTFKLLGR